MNVKERLPLSNSKIAEKLNSIGDLLEESGDNPYRVKAYRNAATVVGRNSREVSEILEDKGLEGLMELDGIGISLSHVIQRIAEDGHVLLLDRLLKEVNPEVSLASVPGVGKKLAAEIHNKLGIENLHDLEIAANDGRLAAVPGMGEKRLRAVRECLAGRFHRFPVMKSPKVQSHIHSPGNNPEVNVAEILNIDNEYNLAVKKHSLPLITPKRFNPTRSAWLPVLHTVRNNRRYTAMYSNTARAHELGTQRDWVVIYLDGGNLQWTVVTARYGSLAGKRVVRGHERECLEFYQLPAVAAPSR